MSIKNVENKKIIKSFHDKIYGASVDTIESILYEYYHEDANWYGSQPFNELQGRKTLLETFWKPFLTAFPDVQKDVYMHFSGNDPETIDDDWVVSSGNYVGTFKNDWLDIPPTKGLVWIRFVEFNRVVDGKIAETYTMIDILDLMRQAGLTFVKSLAPEINIPGPSTHDGVIIGKCDEEESKKSFQIVYDMTYKGILSFKDKGIGNMGLEKYFSKDFMWYGPCGIGSTRGLNGFEEYHQKPFLKAVPDRNLIHEKRGCFAEGKYCALYEWRGFVATHTGNDWLGVPATNKPIVMRCMDLYRRDGEYLAKNWVFLDMIDILLQMGIDVFDRLRNKKYLL